MKSTRVWVGATVLDILVGTTRRRILGLFCSIAILVFLQCSFSVFSGNIVMI